MFHNLEIPHPPEDHPEAVTVAELRDLVLSLHPYLIPVRAKHDDTPKVYIAGNLRPNQVWGWVINCAYTLYNMQPMLDTDAGLDEVSLFITMKVYEMVSGLEMIGVNLDLPFSLENPHQEDV